MKPGGRCVFPSTVLRQCGGIFCLKHACKFDKFLSVTYYVFKTLIAAVNHAVAKPAYGKGLQQT